MTNQQEAVGVIETLGFPAVLAAADAMVKGGRVTIVYFDKAERGNFIVVIRGGISEVRPAMEAGLLAAENTFGGKVMTHYTVPNPPDNVVAVLPIEYTEQVAQFRS
ncbi:MAG: carbon dioxide-concentrating mechanism protein CcmK [Xenococcaceae cyanobacterium MO_167.B52]|nr:carbon dioxide-concentrating mechanism protein CcmK [Xenococcaceae cyanobacterium MO_167.B52]